MLRSVLSIPSSQSDTGGVLRVSFPELVERLTRALRNLGFDPENAALCARLFAETTRDGVYSHGVRRFPRFAAMVRSGLVQPNAIPMRTAQCGALERWDGQSGPGNGNAWRSMERAITLARESGIGCVALANTNHWMRGGTYGWQAAEAGVIGLCWTNTMPNLPPWGGTTPTVGNNPLVLAVPRTEGPIVLDIAMSQFSYGALESYRDRGESLPVIGGFDAVGDLTRDPAAIEQTQRPLPIGFWKGSGLAFVLDVIGAALAGGQATCEIAQDPLRETGLTQVFVAIGGKGAFGRSPDEIAGAAIRFLQSSHPTAEDTRIRYPGEQTLRIREENLARGIPVERALWEELG
jgi:3-dehydro-L-gulonate 2-dehydrogenase